MIEQCRVCGGKDLVEWMRDGRLRDCVYYRCTGCGLWNYDLECGLDQTQYAEAYHPATDDHWPPNAENRQAWEALTRFLGAPGSLLDIGCGNGSFMIHAKAAGWQVAGLELSPMLASAVARDLSVPVEPGNFLEPAAPQSARFDVVVLRHVLEHLPDPHLAMQRIHERLSPGGMAYLEFPNTGSFSYKSKRILKNLGLRNKKYAEDWRPGHCNEYCRRAFEALLDATGFELVAWETYSHSTLGNALYRLVPMGSKARAVIRRKDDEAVLRAA